MIDFGTYNARFEQFSDELMLWNRTHSLTAYKSKAEIMANILDSIKPLEFVADFESVLDIGSGSGFPAILLAIMRENARFVLLEPNRKKYSFLVNLTISLHLTHVCVIKCRIQELDSAILREYIDVESVNLITSRALYATNELIALSEKFLSDDGYFLFYKGADEAMGSDYRVQGKRAYFYKKKD